MHHDTGSKSDHSSKKTVHNSLVHNYPKLQTAQMLINTGMDRFWYIHTYSNENESTRIT